MALISAIITRVNQYGYGTDQATPVLEAINEEIRELYLIRPWQWREGVTNLNATIGSNAVALTAGMGAVETVRLQDGADGVAVASYDLEYLDPIEFRRREQLDIPPVNSRPVYWTRWSNGLRLLPRPDKAYTVKIDGLTVLSADLTTATEVPLPWEYEDIVVYGAIYRLAIRQRDQWLAEWAYGKRNELLAIAARDDDERQRAREEKVVQSASKWSDWNAR